MRRLFVLSLATFASASLLAVSTGVEPFYIYWSGVALMLAWLAIGAFAWAHRSGVTVR